MKTISKILRSILTSLLFIILLLGTIIQFAFTSIHFNNTRLPDLIDRKAILYLFVENIDDENIENIAIDYIDKYINYTFYKRSYPSIESDYYQKLPEEERDDARKVLAELQDKIDLDYEQVLIIRDINNFLSNSSIYLLINVGLFVIIILICIVRSSFKRGLKTTGLAIALAGIIILIGGSVLHSNLNLLLNPVLYNFVIDMIGDDFMKMLFNQAVIYTVIGLFLFIISYIVDSLGKEKEN